MHANRTTAQNQPRLTLIGGATMPVLGFGTFELEPDQARHAVAHALEVGYRHVDTADLYENHAAVGQAIAESPVPREDIFLVTKVWHDRLHHDDVLADAHRFLDELKTEYVDQLLIHWPNSDVPMKETFAAFDELVRDGKVRTVGVSNFTPGHIEKAIQASPQPIVANQVELHPYLAQPDLRQYCREHDVAVVAYRPIVKGKVNEDATLKQIGAKHDKTPVQVTLRWMIRHGLVTIPRSKSPEHIEQNFAALSFELDDEDMQRIDALDRGEREIVPAHAEFDGPR